MPEFWTWWIENGPTMSTLSPSASVRPTICFVSWSATTAAPATTRRAIHCGRPAASDRSRRRDGLERVGGRADADVDRCGSGRAGSLTQRSSARLSSMQSVAYGTASSRSSAIGRPQTAQVPYVPSSIRRAPRRSRRGRARRSPRGRRRARACTSRSRCRRGDRPAPIARSPVSSSSEPVWLTASRACCSRSRSRFERSRKAFDVDAHRRSSAAAASTASAVSSLMPSSTTTLSRDEAPAVSSRSRRARSRVLARRSRTASFARPPSGGALTRTFQASPWRPTIPGGSLPVRRAAAGSCADPSRPKDIRARFDYPTTFRIPVSVTSPIAGRVCGRRPPTSRPRLTPPATRRATRAQPEAESGS